MQLQTFGNSDVSFTPYKANANVNVHFTDAKINPHPPYVHMYPKIMVANLGEVWTRFALMYQKISLYPSNTTPPFYLQSYPTGRSEAMYMRKTNRLRLISVLEEIIKVEYKGLRQGQ